MIGRIDHILNSEITKRLNSLGRKVTVVKANSVGPVPLYPYVAYTATQIRAENGGSFSETDEGEIYKALDMVISYTIRSDRESETFALAQKLADFFDYEGTLYLNDHDIETKRVGSVTNRDNLLTNGYEYAQGFDITLTLTHFVNARTDEFIEAAPIKGTAR